MKLVKQVLLLLFVLMGIALNSITIEVNQDSSADFTIIQEAINSSTNGDTVLVHPGTYYENIDMNHKDITLCSLEATTGDSAYIESTIINGNQSGSCIKIMNDETVTIQGFSLTNGSGTSFNFENQGGGLIAWDFSTLNFISCNIYGNKANIGGGVFLRYSNAFISNLNIYDNEALYHGGGLCIFGWYPVYNNLITEFDQINRCSIYDNYSASFQDLVVDYMSYEIDIYLDKVSFENPSEFYIGGKDAEFTLDYLSFEHDYINSDLYVSPDGSDENSGLTVDSPFKNIRHAIHNIASDSLYPKTITLLPGTYTLTNQDHLISLKSNITLRGEDRDETIIDGMNILGSTISVAWYTGNSSITDLTIRNTAAGAILGFKECGDILIENISIENCSADHFAGISFMKVADLTINDVSVIGCDSPRSSAISAEYTDNCYINELLILNNSSENSLVGNSAVSVGVVDDFVLTNSIFRNNQTFYYDEYFDDTGTSTLQVVNSGNTDFINSWRIENCLFYENETFKDYNCNGGFTLTASSAANNGYFINNTVINNTGMRTMFLGGLDTYVMNNIFYNDNSISNGSNNGYELFVPNTFPAQFHSNITFSNNIIKNGYDGYHDDYPAFNEETWINDPIDLEPMLDSVNTEFPYFPLYNSPVVDAGSVNFPEGYDIPEFDLVGNPRTTGVEIDIGCYEWVEGMTSVEEESMIINSKYRINNYPNPFNPTTTISFSLNTKITENTEIEIYNAKGQKVKSFVCHPELDEGCTKTHTITWNGTDRNNNPVSSGIYFYNLKSGNRVVASKKMLLMK